ncbi:MAG: FAD-dependent oxidoreductase [bacterium]|nr:FAD-dependent oxidoreductase [bacterium]
MITVTKATVKNIIEHKNDLKEYILESEKYRRYQPGMFLQLTLETVTASDIWPESRTFSICNAYNKSNKEFKLIIRNMGKYTNEIFTRLKIGSTCSIKYAFGDLLLPADSTDKSIICIAGGSGIAPFLSFIEDSEQKNAINDFYLFYSAKTIKELLHLEQIKNSLKSNQLYTHITQEKTDKHINRRIDIDDILSSVPNNLEPYFYICGPPDFISHFKTCLSYKGFNNIHTDEWE